ncbi:MAG: MmgE/PrpD family protein [Deltaproteobacteria bacterium]|nr:MmgE/PrpD family protein [Deltaproteobacteria bacterium]
MAENNIAERLADFGLGLRFDDLPQEVVHETKRRVIDTLACMLGAYDCPPVKAVRAMAPAVSDGPCAGILGSPGSTTPDFAAFANGVMARYLDFNDTYLSKEPAHPSDNIPAALACAEAAGASGAEFIAAVVAAYEVHCALCDAASLRTKGWDHVTYGSFSSTVAASMLLRLSREEAMNALGIAGVASPALRQTRGGELSMWKGFAFANAARNAVFAAFLAKNGITGPSPVFEGEFGFFKLVSGPFDLPAFPSGRSNRFKILETYMKYYPAEYHAQSAIEAAVELSREIDDVSSIDSVAVSTFSACYDIIGHGLAKRRPKTRETADHSLAYCVAAALMDGNITVDTFSGDRLRDSRLLGLIDRVEIIKDPEFDRLYPESMPNSVVVVLKSGDVLSKEVIYPRGHPKTPFTDVEVEEKFKRLGGPYFGGGGVDSALRSLWALDEMKEIGALLSLFKAGRT